MGKLVVVEHVTLDGVMQAPGGADEDTRGGFPHGGWAQPYTDHVMAETMGKGMNKDGVMLFGRRTYEQFYGFWSRQTDGNPYTEVLNRNHKARRRRAACPGRRSIPGPPAGGRASRGGSVPRRAAAGRPGCPAVRDGALAPARPPSPPSPPLLATPTHPFARRSIRPDA
jgi:hypothetical protein